MKVETTKKFAKLTVLVTKALNTTSSTMNALLKRLCSQSAQHLDVAESSIHLDYGKAGTGPEKGQWGWRAELRRSDGTVEKLGPLCDDPLAACIELANLLGRS